MLATVKGDVHDIGKNIVGVVLGCNNYDVVDLGVMVAGDTILDTALEEGADVVGLADHASLDEMVTVAREMQRRGLDLPLLIGGATTSKQHTAVKIAPEYERPVLHVLDASRVVGVVFGHPRSRAPREARRREPSCRNRLREQHAEKGASRCSRSRLRVRMRRAVVRGLPSAPAFIGRRVVEPDLETLIRYVDWQFFFHAWELKGKYPAILEQPAARELYDDALALLERIVGVTELQARGVYGFWPARRDGDDVIVDESSRFHFLRQRPYGDSRPNRSLADFWRRSRLSREGGLAWRVRGNQEKFPSRRSIGAFAVSIHGADELAARYEAEHDDYDAIMVKALADRLAEAFAEYLHQQARREWYAGDEELSNEDMFAERFRGIRPAFGYPACPDHTEKRTLFELLGAGEVGLELTESYAMIPPAAVSGIYLAHPGARYFSVGRIGRDQLEDYAARKGFSTEEGERWLAPNLAYTPQPQPALS